MNLMIEGRKAIVCGASKGLGRGTALALAREGVQLWIAARNAQALEAAHAELAAITRVHAVRADVTTEAGRAALLAACPEPDILINNAGGPPPGDFKDFTLEQWRGALEANMLSPLALIQSTVYGMMERGFGRIVNITSAAVKAPIAGLELSNGARSGLTGAVAVLARKAARHNVTINNLLPGLHDTDRLRTTHSKLAAERGISIDAALAERGAQLPAGRLGRAEDFGATCAFLCSEQAGFITGQNLLVDGGNYGGLL